MTTTTRRKRVKAGLLRLWRRGFWVPLALVVGIGVLVPLAAGQTMPKVPAPGESTFVASPTSVVTMLTTTHPDGSATLELLIVWRGKPNWFGVSGLDFRSEGGQTGTKTVFHHTYGTVKVHVKFDRQSRETTLDGSAVALKDGANVILVDDVDDAEKKRRVVEQLTIDASLGHWKSDPRVVLTRSEQLVKFLQCDAALAHSASRPSFTKLCEQLRPR